jgi:hypothetical protein
MPWAAMLTPRTPAPLSIALSDEPSDAAGVLLLPMMPAPPPLSPCTPKLSGGDSCPGSNVLRLP